MKQIVLEMQQEIAVIRIQFPPRNAVTLDFARQLDQAMLQARNSDCQAIVLTGQNDSFCAGMDLKEVPLYCAEQQQQLLMTANRVIQKIYSSPKPVVAAVNGHAVGAGLMLVLSTDYRIAPDSEVFRYGLTEARSGLPFPAAPAVVLRHEMAPADVRFMTLYSKNIKVQRAREMGVFDELVAQDQVLARSIEIARDLASMPADAYKAVKMQFRYHALKEIAHIVEHNADPMLKVWVSEEGEEAADKVLAAPPSV